MTDIELTDTSKQTPFVDTSTAVVGCPVWFIVRVIGSPHASQSTLGGASPSPADDNEIQDTTND